MALSAIPGALQRSAICADARRRSNGGTELSLPLFTMEIDTNESRFEELVHGILQKTRTTKDEKSLHADKVFIVTKSQVCISHYNSFELKKKLLSRTLTLDSAAAYHIVGGTGGLGRSMTTWMVEHRSTKLILLSRRAGKNDESQNPSHELEQMGCSVHLVAGIVEKPDDIERAIASTKTTIKGVLWLAMVLKVSWLDHLDNFTQLKRQ
jgi:hypothetical protein